MKTMTTIALATVIAAASGFAQANGVETYGRSAPSTNSGITVPSAGTNVDVASVQGRASIIRSAQRGNAPEVMIVARSATEVQGRS